MRKIITSALITATFIGAMATATVASAQEWGGPPPPPHSWDRGPGEWGGPLPSPYEGEWRARRDWQIQRDHERRYDDERRYEAERHRDWCRWNRCY